MCSGKEPLHDGIVPAVSLATHAAPQAMAQPTILREYKFITVARYNQPLRVRM